MLGFSKLGKRPPKLPKLVTSPPVRDDGVVEGPGGPGVIQDGGQHGLSRDQSALQGTAGVF